ncbi:MAG: hypothetical protein R2862_04690 [Thermoanaerobaculia bacterium]
MVYEGEQQGPEVVARKLIGTAVKRVFEARFPSSNASLRKTSRDRTPRSSPGSPEGRRSPSPTMPFARTWSSARVPSLFALAESQGGGREETAFWAEPSSTACTSR